MQPRGPLILNMEFNVLAFVLMTPALAAQTTTSLDLAAGFSAPQGKI